jgi:SsrA-binding protein
MKKINRKAKFNYKLLDSFEAGIVLNGAEVKAIRNGQVDISNSYAKIVNNEAYLINANIPVSGKKDYSPTRTRKLLLHKDEIISIKTDIKAKKLTLVPTKVYTKHNLVKVELALAKPKRQFQKKESIKKRDIERDLERELKEREI